MGLKPMLSFSSGEVDPILHDRVTLEKFKKGLATARNVMIGKTGSIMSRFSRAHFVKAKNDDEPIKLFSPPNSGVLLEFGLSYIRVYDFDATLLGEVSITLTEDQLSKIHFVPTADKVHILIYGVVPILFDYINIAFVTSEAYDIGDTTYDASTSITPAGSPTGYQVDYAVSIVFNGEEYTLADLTSLGTFLKPDATGESNTLSVKLPVADFPLLDISSCNELRVYRRPNGGGAFGFLGASTDIYTSGGFITCDYIDVGSLADFTNNPPNLISEASLGGGSISLMSFKTGTIYQQRLLLGNIDNVNNRGAIDSEAIIASRPGYRNNFYRDYPYDADSSLNFKSGTSGKAEVLRMIDNDGLIVFTSVGVFINLGVLSIDNVALEKKGSWVIDESIPPLAVPGGVFFVDKSTNAIRQFIFSENIQTYQSTDQSIFSDHLFKNRTITSWAFQGGVASLIIVTFSDGTFATFTYDFEHQMRAWTRHDSEYPIEQVEDTGIVDSTFFVTNKDGNRYIEVSLPREIPADTYESNPEADKLALNCFSDANTTKQNLLNDSLAGTDTFELTPVVADDWEGQLTLTCGTSALFPSPGLGDVGTIMRFFDVTDRSAVDLEVISRTDDDTVVVEPSAEFPSAQASDFRLYETFNQVTGLTHLEGESVTVMVDGFVVASPNNDVENYDPIIVSGGVIDIPTSVGRGAIIIVGRPITADVKTLNISTVEQAPTLVESLTVDKLYIRFHESRGMYVGNIFPEEKTGDVDGSSVEGMQDLDVFFVPDGYDIIANRYKQPVSKRIEQTIPGTWKNNGQIAIRQVDPLHFQILSIIPDVEVLTRSNR